ncbi:hypothetical protein A8L34_13395 [Bacillus sp. FJAT-27264]|uniref:DUF5808 domain-containing protein n=1 Tax=Paenibacillus sp. (strain DSM 101736 / FJAT-27264) TaxID=1850362 RepID=UPI000807BBFF|nr:DUF5808 domain-containing protein [Bacillus sp. FJAT-27264]OBZ14880.1 hypothetical protein A8L34_13395 [Bacillus sp. FJAT-27264]
MQILFLFIGLLIFTIVLATYASQLKPRDYLWFGVSLPPEAMEDVELTRLRVTSKKRFATYSVWVLLALLPLLFLTKYVSLVYIYTMVWAAVMIYVLRIPFLKAHRAAKEIKVRNGWFVGEKRVVRVDTKLSLLKERMMISPFWFIVPAVIGAVPFIIGGQRDGDNRVIGAVALATVVLMFVVFRAFGKMKPKVHGTDSELNVKLNKISLSYWSLLWLGLAVLNSVSAVLLAYALQRESFPGNALWISGVIIVSVLPVIGILLVHHKVQTLSADIAGQGEGGVFVTDDDEYWINGTTYNNPSDSSFMVPKRIGIGTTINTGTKVGKSIYHSLFVFLPVVLIGTGWMTVQSEFSTPHFALGENRQVSIEYPLYNYSFNLKDAEEIKLVDALPRARRTNGISMDTVAIGNFKLDTYGKTKLYTYRNSPPYIVIKLPDIYVVYNTKVSSQTERIFADLQER